MIESWENLETDEQRHRQKAKVILLDTVQLTSRVQYSKINYKGMSLYKSICKTNLTFDSNFESERNNF